MANPSYVDYIKRHKTQYSLEVLKQGLLKAGATPADIEDAIRAEALAAAPPPFVPVPVPAAAPVSSWTPAQAPPSSPSGSGYSHPEARVRHSYPLAEKEDGLAAAFRLCLKTAPFILLRLGLLVGFSVATILWYCLTLGLASLFSRVAGGLGFWVFAVGLGLPGAAFMWFRRYMLFMLKTAHVAVLTRLITHGELPPGADQIQYGKDMVASHFGEINALFALHLLVQGVVRAFTRSVDWIAGFLPIPGLEGALGAARKILENATSYVDEAIFSYNLARGDENPWRSSKDGLIYYAQNWKPVLKTGVYGLVLEYASSFLTFLVLLVPALAVASMLPKIGTAVVIFAILIAMNVKSAVLRPLFMTMVALTFHKAIHEQEIDAQYEQTLNSASDKFRELSEKARNLVPGKVGAILNPGLRLPA